MEQKDEASIGVAFIDARSDALNPSVTLHISRLAGAYKVLLYKLDWIKSQLVSLECVWYRWIPLNISSQSVFCA